VCNTIACVEYVYFTGVTFALSIAQITKIFRTFFFGHPIATRTQLTVFIWPFIALTIKYTDHIFGSGQRLEVFGEEIRFGGVGVEGGNGDDCGSGD
jgi:hypothetical protein